MEKQPYQEYRDELKDKLKEIRNSDPKNPEISKAKAQGYLEAKRETLEYIESEKKHNLNKPTLEKRKVREEVSPYVDILINNLREIKSTTFRFTGNYEIRSVDKDSISLEIDIDMLGEPSDALAYLNRIRDGFVYKLGEDILQNQEQLVPEELNIFKQIDFVVDNVDKRRESGNGRVARFVFSQELKKWSMMGIYGHTIYGSHEE